MDPPADKTDARLRRIPAPVAVMLFIAAFASMARNYSSAHFGAGYEIINIAKTLAQTGTFGNPYGVLPTGPTAHCAPLFPMFLAMLIRLFGYSASFVIAAGTCALVMYALHAMLLPYVSSLFFGCPGPGIAAALMTIVLPLFFFLPHFDMIYDAVGVMIFCLVSTSFVRTPGPGRALGIGAFLGILALLNPASLIIAGLWIVYLAWRHSSARLWRWAPYMAAALVLVVAPWTIRNYLRFHQFVPVRDNLGVELYISNNDMSAATFVDNLPSLWQHHPAASVDEARAVIQMGEAAYSDSRQARAIAWIRSHPARFLELFAERARMFWFSDHQDSPAHARSIIFVTVASFGGLLLLWLRRQAIWLFLAATWTFYPLLYYCVQHDVRYREPILWLTLLPAGYLAWTLWERLASAKLEKLWQFRM